MVEIHVSELAKSAGLENPDRLARQLMLLTEGAIVTAHLGYSDNPAQDAKSAAIALIGEK
jgi:hypothetical protein